MGKLKFGKWEKSGQFFRNVTGKKLSKPTFLQCQFVGQDVVRTFRKYSTKWNGMEKNGLKGDRLLTVTLGISGEIEIWKMGKIRTIFETCHRKRKKKQI